MVYGLVRDYRVIIVPLGPKLFTFLASLVAMTYLGEVAIWRVQYSRSNAADSLPGTSCISAVLDVALLKELRSREFELWSSFGLASNSPTAVGLPEFSAYATGVSNNS
jgi:hypothetical protein